MHNKQVALYPALVVLIAALVCPVCWSQISGNVYQRTFLIKTTAGEGTAFAIDIDGRQYLVTAKHVVKGLRDADDVRIFRAKEWKTVRVQVLRCNDPIDIAVLAPDKIISRASPIPTSGAGDLYFGQELYFLGFPFGWSMEFSQASPDPIAIVKRGVLSAVLEYNGAKLMLVDGYNNFGFSGGPIVYHEVGKSGYDLTVAAVVSGFQPELRPVVRSRPMKQDDHVADTDAWRVRRRADGQSDLLEDTGEFVPVNTGFLRAFDIGYAIEVVRKNPVGPKIAP